MLSNEEKQSILTLSSKTFSIRRLKKWARKKLPEQSPLRYVILKEKDRLDGTDFLSRGMT